MRRIRVRAPSNIAIVKYMGKTDAGLNLPANPSFSMTLDRLSTVLEWTERPALSGMAWAEEPSSETPAGWDTPALNEAGRRRFFRHAERAWVAAGVLLSSRGLEIRSDSLPFAEIASANSFPAASGIASSASSFAALTLAAFVSRSKNADQFKALWANDLTFRRSVSAVSRQGSGSSCRSFEGPWVRWDSDQAHGVSGSQIGDDWSDLVILVGKEPKEVSSSEAHARVTSSPLWVGRPERARQRVEELERAIREGNRRALAEIAWAEFWEMHSLFHTSAEPFSYWLPKSSEVLQWLKPQVESGLNTSEKPPVVTMDAGPNIHLLVPTAEVAEWLSRIESRFAGTEVLVDRCGQGAVIEEIQE